LVGVEPVLVIRIPVDGDLCLTILMPLLIKPLEIGGEAEEARDVKSKTTGRRDIGCRGKIAAPVSQPDNLKTRCT
jgi:hypothetical protein